MSCRHGRPIERNNSITHDATEGPTLTDCRALIARIDGTMAALRHERERLEERAGRLTAGEAPREASHAG